ncbi:MAG: pectinesterase family protein [Muribaculaceae bacterium]|nr:pectinesterase family protein [Muribaculaceae bacterium]
MGAEYKRELYVNPDGSGDYTNVTDALEGIRAYMDYTVTVHIAPGTYKEKVIIPSWLTNVVFVGEGAKPEDTVITWDDHANINKMGTFRTYTVRVDGNDITFRNLTIENNAPQLGQAVALHTEGDRLKFENCRILGNQDTVFTGGENMRLFFDNCYIDGTTDFIFGPATAYFKDCNIHSKRDSFITAASTPENVAVGYVFENCHLTADPEVQKVYLGRPWRPYAHTMFINCDMDKHIRAERWQNWGKKENEVTSRYGEYGSKGPGAEGQCDWAKNPDPETVKALTDLKKVFSHSTDWNPTDK